MNDERQDARTCAEKRREWKYSRSVEEENEKGETAPPYERGRARKQHVHGLDPGGKQGGEDGDGVASAEDESGRSRGGEWEADDGWATWAAPDRVHARASPPPQRRPRSAIEGFVRSRCLLTFGFIQEHAVCEALGRRAV